MANRKLIFGILALLVAILLGFIFRISIYEEYLKLFKKSGIVGQKDQSGQFTGGVIFYNRGALIERSNYVKGLKQGWAFSYYESGELKRKVYFVNNVADGDEYKYYKNGQINYRGNILHGNRYGSLFWYAENGNLDSYATFDIKGNSFYLEQFDSSGKVDSVDGSLVCPRLYSYNIKSDSLIVLDPRMPNKDINDLYITIATPPNEYHDYLVIINNKSIGNLPIKGNTIKISSAFPEKGSYEISIVTYMPDENGKMVKWIGLHTVIMKD